MARLRIAFLNSWRLIYLEFTDSTSLMKFYQKLLTSRSSIPKALRMLFYVMNPSLLVSIFLKACSRFSSQRSCSLLEAAVMNSL